MLNFLSIVLIILIIIFLVIFKRKYIFNAFNKKKLYPIKEMDNENNIIPSSAKQSNYFQHSSIKYLEFDKK